MAFDPPAGANLTMRTTPRVIPRVRSRVRTLVAQDAYDDDATAYIQDVETALGSTITQTQRAALNTWFRRAKITGRWDLIGRFYLMIWGSAAANAICLRTRLSGTFVGGVTQAAGYVAGDGTTGYFEPDAGGTFAPLGITGADLHYAVVKKTANAATVFKVDCGQALDGTVAQRAQLIGTSLSSGEARFYCPDNTGLGSRIMATPRGVMIASATASNSRYLHRRTTAGETTTAPETTEIATALPDVVPFLMARNTGGVATEHTVAEFGAFGYGRAIPAADAPAYSADDKTLWETCTGLTLP